MRFESTGYRPLLLFNGEGDCLAVKVRPGNVDSAEDWALLAAPAGRASEPAAIRGDAEPERTITGAGGIVG